MSQTTSRTYTKTFQLEANSSGATTVSVRELLRCTLATSRAHDEAIRDMDGMGTFIGADDAWVVTRYAIEVEAFPPFGESFTITTQLTAVSSLMVTRLFVVRDETDSVLAQIYAQFVAINLTTRKLIRVDLSNLETHQFIYPELDRRFARIRMPNDPEIEEMVIRSVEGTDIDGNGHVNNVSYIQWCQDTLPEPIFEGYTLQHLDVKYGKEVMPQDEVTIDTAIAMGPDRIQTTHRITNNSTQAEACRMQMTWIK